MKKIFALGLCLIMAMSLMAGCGIVKSTESDVPPVSSESSSESEEPTTEPTESLPEESETSESESESESASESKVEIPVEPVEGLSDKYVDFDNRSFAVNGKVYTLGVNTLQDMIDDGVPFNENDIANANNNLNPNYESSGFRIVLGEYYSAQVNVANYSDENAVTADCVLSEVYLPVHSDEEQNILQFSFPITLTEEDLLAQAGEPTDRSEYTSEDSDYVTHTLKYKVDSENYYGSSGYTFEFVNGELDYITIDWLL